MTLAKKILIQTETREIIILRAGAAGGITGYCEQCGRDAYLLTLDQAVSLTGLSTKELFELSEKGSVHAIETESRHLLVCAESIGKPGLNSMEKKEQ